jgi:hypothetical protein
MVGASLTTCPCNIHTHRCCTLQSAAEPSSPPPGKRMYRPSDDAHDYRGTGPTWDAPRAEGMTGAKVGGISPRACVERGRGVWHHVGLSRRSTLPLKLTVQTKIGLIDDTSREHGEGGGRRIRPFCIAMLRSIGAIPSNTIGKGPWLDVERNRGEISLCRYPLSPISHDVHPSGIEYSRTSLSCHGRRRAFLNERAFPAVGSPSCMEGSVYPDSTNECIQAALRSILSLGILVSLKGCPSHAHAEDRRKVVWSIQEMTCIPRVTTPYVDHLAPKVCLYGYRFSTSCLVTSPIGVHLHPPAYFLRHHQGQIARNVCP